MINKNASNHFSQLITDLQHTITTVREFEQLKETIIDLLARGLIDTSTEQALYREFNRLMTPISNDLIRQTTNTYNDLIQATNYYYRDLADDLGRNHVKIRAIERVNAARIGAFSKRTSRRIAKVIRHGLIKGVSAQEMGRLLANKTTISADIAKTLGNTQVAGYGNACKMTKATIGGVFIFEYAGFKRSTTRDFCLPMIGFLFHIDDLKKMRNGQIEPVITYCGGFNCHHHPEPDPDAKAPSPGQWHHFMVGHRSLSHIIPL